MLACQGKVGIAELLDPGGLVHLFLAHQRINPAAVAANECTISDVAQTLLGSLGLFAIGIGKVQLRRRSRARLTG